MQLFAVIRSNSSGIPVIVQTHNTKTNQFYCYDMSMCGECNDY